VNCPDCATEVGESAQYCPNCGAQLAEHCSDCGADNPAAANFCAECGTDLSASASDDAPDADADAAADGAPEDVFRLTGGTFARRVSGDALEGDGLLSRLKNEQRIKIEAGTEALVIRDGELAETLPAGEHTLDDITRQVAEARTSQSLSVVLVRRGDTPLTFAVSDLLTADGVQVSAELELVATVDDEEAFFRNFTSGRDAVTRETFRSVLGPAIRDDLEARVSEYERSELYGNDALKRDLEAVVTDRLSDVLGRNGLELLSVRSFEYEDGREELREERTELANREERESLRDEAVDLDKQARERETGDEIHAARQEARQELTENAASHEVEKQEVEHDHEIDDVEREHRHEAEREDVEHTQEIETRRTEGEVDRRDLEHEQDVSEMEDMIDLKDEKERLDVEREKERLDARNDIDAQTLASLEDADDSVADIARMEAAEDLSADQLDSLGARENDELAKARQEANSAEVERKRVEDQKEFREDLKDVAGDAMDRTQETTESAMDNMGETATEAARDGPAPDDEGDEDDERSRESSRGDGDGDGADAGASDATDTADAADATGTEPRECPDCGASVAADDGFCTDCGATLGE